MKEQDKKQGWIIMNEDPDGNVTPFATKNKKGIDAVFIYDTEKEAWKGIASVKIKEFKEFVADTRPLYQTFFDCTLYPIEVSYEDRKENS